MSEAERLARVKRCLKAQSIGDAVGELFFYVSEEKAFELVKARKTPESTPPPWFDFNHNHN